MKLRSFLRLSLVPLAIAALVQPGGLVYAGNFDMNNPSPKSCLLAGQTQIIDWDADSSYHATLSLATDGGTPQTLTTDATNRQYTWTVPFVTTQKAVIHATYHDASGTTIPGSIPDQTSDAFSIDASPPSLQTLNLVSKTDTSATLSWSTLPDVGCGTFSGYNLYRTDVSPRQLIQKLGATATNYTVTGLQASSSATFVLSAFDTGTYGNVASTDGTPLTVKTDAAATPTPTATPTPSPSATPTPTASPSATPTATVSPSATPVVTSAIPVTTQVAANAKTLGNYILAGVGIFAVLIGALLIFFSRRLIFDKKPSAPLATPPMPEVKATPEEKPVEPEEKSS